MLTADDPCRAATDPAAWAGDCCHTTGSWRMRPGLPVPEEAWVATVLHTLKARLIALLLSQRPLPLNRILRGHSSLKKWQMASGLAALLSEGTRYLPALPLTRVLGSVDHGCAVEAHGRAGSHRCLLEL